MKSKYLSAAAALLCAAGLAACGGSGNGSIGLGAQVYGLDRSGLVLLNNGGDELAVDRAGTWYFKTLMAPDSAFNVTIKSKPDFVECTLSNNTGKINYYSYQQTIVSCTPVPFVLGGSVTGLTAEGLVLANGSLTVGVAANSANWEFSSKISNGAVYGVTVLAQPAGQTCTVANAVGTMPTSDKRDVNVTCQNK
jgi:hypothetical protein